MPFQNGDAQIREEVMAYVRQRARDLSLKGLSPHEIVAHIDGGGLSANERELLWSIARVEVASAADAGSGS